MSLKQFPAIMLPIVVAMGCGDRGPVQLESSAEGFGARSANAGSTFTFREPLNFTLTPATCPSLTTIVTGTGVSHLTVHASQSTDGALHFSFHNSVKGTATGADGSAYRFTYNLSAKQSAEEPPFVVTLVDNFHLLGQGSTPNLAVHQYYDFIVYPDGSFIDLKVRVRGDPGCDPI